MNNLNTLIIFTRFPEPGKTKTRLIPHLGAEGAAQLQKEMTEYTVRQARRAGAEIEIRYTGGSFEQMHGWLGENLNYAEQGEGDLGERMERAFTVAFSNGATKAIIVGSDCPSSDWKNMQVAFHGLEENDCVIGPASDGGYYLIGLRGRRSRLQQGESVGGVGDPARQLFHNIDWGGEQVFEQTMKAASGLSVGELKQLPDVDLPKDIPSRISIIIPTLNEVEHLPQTLKQMTDGFNLEVLVVDGGSTDGTQELIPDGLECREGRAAQQNFGAATATGEILFFLHADTQLPEGWEWTIRETLADSSVALGAFLFKVDSDFPGRKFIEDTANWRSKKGGLPFGDQGFFLRRKTFDAAGGFPDQPIMEDYAFARTLRRHGKIITVPQAAITSGRRWEKHGVLKVTLVNKLMILGYHLGVSPERLAAFYRK